MPGSSKLLWYVHRLRAMSLSEMWHRVCERQRHKSDAAFARRADGVTLGEAAAYPALPERAQAPQKLCERLAVNAKELLAGDWLLYGWRRVSTGAPPCWHRDATCGVIIEPDELSHRLDHRHLPDPADVRTIWEINRWSEMTRVMMHAWLNQDYDAARTAQTWLEDWVERNPVGRGINWTSPLEAALRLMNFAWFDALVHACGQEHLTSRQRVLAERIVPVHALWVHRYRSFGSSANNHLLGELVGLLHAVKRWPALKANVGMADSLWKDIAACVMEQFAPDGGNREQALHYHLFAWEMAWHACQAMQVTDGPVPERLLQAAEFFVRMSHPREPWDYGDSDDAQIIPLTMDRSKAVAEWHAWLSGTHDEEAAALSFWLGTQPTRSAQAGSLKGNWWIARESGMAVIEKDGWKVRVDASPLGYGKMAAHGHCDALHVSIWDGDHALVIDPGTGGYFGNVQARDMLRCWQAHNGPLPTCEGKYATPVAVGTFLQCHHHVTPELIEHPDSIEMNFDHEDCRFRRIVTIKGEGIEIVDQSRKEDSFTVSWTFAPEVALGKSANLADQHELLMERDGRSWSFRTDGAVATSFSRGEVSRAFRFFEEAEGLTCGSKGQAIRTLIRRVLPS